jgi:hypothetical protein
MSAVPEGRKKEDGMRKKEEGRRNNEEGIFNYISNVECGTPHAPQCEDTTNTSVCPVLGLSVTVKMFISQCECESHHHDHTHCVNTWK